LTVLICYSCHWLYYYVTHVIDCTIMLLMLLTILICYWCHWLYQYVTDAIDCTNMLLGDQDASLVESSTK